MPGSGTASRATWPPGTSPGPRSSDTSCRACHPLALTAHMTDRWVSGSAAASVVVLLVSWALLGLPAPRSADVGGIVAPPGRPALLERVPYATGRVLDVHLPPS